MELAAKLDDYGKPAWIAVMILGFIVFWPIGLAILGYMIWSGRMGCSKRGGPGRWHNSDRTRGGSYNFGRGKRSRTSGNTAFDEYRQETLRRLEEEAAQFNDFLTSLRDAKDKAEFDQFMAQRGSRAERAEDIGPDTPDTKDISPGPAANPQS
ncbi:MAG: DUF2852 domain-containing protein [Fimbriimonadaceae bacterium]|nr:DUF2852 domain-containing protein [Alphaproteobacteria bacterium]